MKTHKKVTIIIVLCLVFGMGTAALWYFKSDHFQALAGKWLIARLQVATGLTCTIQTVNTDILNGRFKIKGLALRPSSGASGPLSLTVDDIDGRLSISSLWRLKIRLSELSVLHPQLVLISSEKGSGWSPEEMIQTLRMSFEIEAGQVRIQNGVVDLNDKVIPLVLSLSDLACELRYVPSLPGYRIHISYSNSHLNWAERDIPYGLDARFNLSVAGLEIESYELRHEQTLLGGSGSVRNWNSPVLSVRCSGVFDGRDLVFFEPSLFEIRGDLYLLADLELDARGFRGAGTVSTQNGSFRGTAVNQFRSKLSIDRNVLNLRDVTGRIGSGSIQAEAAFQLDADAKTANHVKIAAQGLAIKYAGRILRLPFLDFDNSADSLIEMDWRQGMEDMELNGSANVRGIQEPASSPGATTLGGEVRFRLSNGVWFIPAAQLSSPHTNIVASTARPGGLCQVQLSTGRLMEPLKVLRRIVPVVDEFLRNQPEVADMPGLYALNGNFQLNSDADIGYSGAIQVKNGRWRSYKVDDVSADAVWTGARIEFDSLSVQSGSAFARGKLDLDLSPREGEPAAVGFAGSIHQISLDTLKELGIQNNVNVAGLLSGEGMVSNESGKWKGAGQVLIERGRYSGEPFDNLKARLQIEDRVLRILQGDVSRGSAHASVTGEVDLATLQLNLRTRFQGLALRELPVLRDKSSELEGYLAAEGSVRGTLSHPSINASFSFTGLRYQTWSLGDGEGKLELKDGIVQSRVGIKFGSGTLNAEATIHTESGLPGKASILLENWNVQRFISGAGPSLLEKMNTTLQGRIDAEGRFEDPSTLVLHGELDGAGIRIRDYEIHNATKIRFSLAKKMLAIEKTAVAGEGTNLTLGGMIPLDGSPNMDLSLNGSLDLKLLQQFEDKLQISGTAGLDVRMTGTTQDPQIIGQMTLKESRLDFSDSPFFFSSLRGNIVFSRSIIRLENVSGNIASGSAQFSGFLEHQNFQLRNLNVQISIQRARLPYPKDLRPVIDAQVALRGNQDAQILSGEVNVVRADYVRDFSLLEQLGGKNLASAGPLTTDPMLIGLRLNLDIHSDSGLYIDNELTRLRAGARLTLRGTPAYPSLTGRIEAAEGSIFFRGNRFDIVHASADFVDRNRITPILDIRAEAEVKTYLLVLDVNGDLDHLTFNVTSDPPLSTVDIISLMTTGKSFDTTSTTTSDAARRQSEMTGLSAASILSESLTGVIGKRVQRIFGLESFRVDPFLAGAENSPTARVTLSERLSQDLTITFSRNLSTSEEQIVIVEYDVNKDLSIVATRDVDGKFGLDFQVRKRFR